MSGLSDELIKGDESNADLENDTSEEDCEGEGNDVTIDKVDNALGELVKGDEDDAYSGNDKITDYFMAIVVLTRFLDRHISANPG